MTEFKKSNPSQTCDRNMYIHKKYLKENITDKQSVNEFAFFLLLKSRFGSSIIYNTPRFNAVCKRTGMDYRTVKKYITLLHKRGLIIKRGEHYKLISIEKEFQYKSTEKGTKDPKWRNKFFRVFLKRKYNLSDYRSVVRGLLTKAWYQKKIHSTVTKQMREQDSKRVKKICRLASNFGKKNASAETESVGMSINLLGKLMKVSPSTAHRTIKRLEGLKLAIKCPGKLELKGHQRLLKVEQDKLPYSVFCYAGLVWQKHINKYVI